MSPTTAPAEMAGGSDIRHPHRTAPRGKRECSSLAMAALLYLAAASAACSRAREPAPPHGTDPVAAPAISPEAQERITAALTPFVETGMVAGIHAVVVRSDRTVYEHTLGWSDVGSRAPLRRDAIFRIYSMTKPVVAAGVLRLVDEGSLHLDDPVSRYIPSFARVRVFAGGTADSPVLEPPASPITIRQLLNHTSGLAYGLTEGPVDTIFRRANLYRAERGLEEFMDSLARIPLLFHPGTGWSYSSGLDVAGRVIEVASGQPLDRFLEERIFRPLRMRDTGFRIRPETRERIATVYRYGPDGALEPVTGTPLMAMFEPEARFLWGSGGLLSTPDDQLRFLRMLLNGGELDGVRVLRPETVALMTRNTLPPELVPVRSWMLEDPTYGFGLGVAVRVDTAGATRPGPPEIFRWSGYLGTYFWVDPVNELIAMVWVQHSAGSRMPIEEVFQRAVYGEMER